MCECMCVCIFARAWALGGRCVKACFLRIVTVSVSSEKC